MSITAGSCMQRLTRRRAASRPPGCSCSGSGRGRAARWCRCRTRACGWPARWWSRWGCGSQWRGCQRPVPQREGWRHLEPEENNCMFLFISLKLKRVRNKSLKLCCGSSLASIWIVFCGTCCRSATIIDVPYLILTNRPIINAYGYTNSGFVFCFFRQNVVGGWTECL